MSVHPAVGVRSTFSKLEASISEPRIRPVRVDPIHLKHCYKEFEKSRMQAQCERTSMRQVTESVCGVNVLEGNSNIGRRIGGVGGGERRLLQICFIV